MSQPKSRPLSAIRPEIRNAALTADLDLLERLLIEASRNGRRRQEFLKPLARLYEECFADEEALATWQESFLDEPSLEAAFQIFRRGSEGRDQSVKDRVRAALSPQAIAAIEGLLEREPATSIGNIRHIAICGTSYCGSTLLGRLLDSLDGFHDIGESHWLINERTKDGGRAAIDFLAPPSATMLHCRQCGSDCTTLSSTFRFRLQLDRRRWYARIANHINTGVLVSSDKNSSKYLTLDPKLRFDAVILFKSPLSAWSSFRKRLASHDHDVVQAKLEAFMTAWRREYDAALRLMPLGKKLFLHFDKLAAEPRNTVAILLQALGMEGHELQIDAVMKGQHAIGGNDGFFEATEASSRIEIGLNPRPELPKDEVNIIALSDVMNALFDEMLTRSQALFGPS